MRTTVEFLGLVAYLTVMYGRLPDPELVEAAYEGRKPGRRPRLRIVPPSEPAPPAAPSVEDQEAAAA